MASCESMNFIARGCVLFPGFVTQPKAQPKADSCCSSGLETKKVFNAKKLIAFNLIEFFGNCATHLNPVISVNFFPIGVSLRQGCH